MPVIVSHWLGKLIVDADDVTDVMMLRSGASSDTVTDPIALFVNWINVCWPAVAENVICAFWPAVAVVTVTGVPETVVVTTSAVVIGNCSASWLSSVVVKMRPL